MSKTDFVLRINNAIFKSSLVKNAVPVFPHRIKHFEIKPGEKWVIWGPGKAKFLNAISNKYLCEPPLSLQFGNTKTADPHVEQVLFKGAIPTAHLSARYEHFKDEFDQTCKKFILDNAIGSNAVSYDVSTTDRVVDSSLYDKLIKELKLTELQDRWAMGLSNGQMRRARLAYSLLKEPDVLVVDDPFLGLDPTATSIISQFLAHYDSDGCPIVIGLRYQDTIPNWCTHICCVTEKDGIIFQGSISENRSKLNEIKEQSEREYKRNHGSNNYSIEDLISVHPMFRKPHHEVIKMPHTIELNGLDVKYKGEPVLQSLSWQVKPGSKWHIRGDNGSGKSTLLSLLTAEHPQSWNSKVVDNGIPRKTGRTNYFDINTRIGMSSPELHAILLKAAGEKLTVKEIVSTGYHEGSSNNFTLIWEKLDENRRLIVKMYLQYFNLYLIADSKLFKDLTVSEQKVVLFIRSVIKMPEILILDEAFSGMELEPMLSCHELLEHWPGTVLVVSHIDEETPSCDHYLKLIAPGEYEIGKIPNKG